MQLFSKTIRREQLYLLGQVISNEKKQLIQAYCDGVNNEIEFRKRGGDGGFGLEFQLLGYEPQPNYGVADVIAWSKLMSLDLSMNMHHEVLRYNLTHSQGLTKERIYEIWPDYPKSAPRVVAQFNATGKIQPLHARPVRNQVPYKPCRQPLGSVTYLPSLFRELFSSFKSETVN